MTAVAEEPPGQIVATPPTLYQRILEAARAVGRVEKDAKNTFHKYSYSSIEAIIDAVHDELLDNGILWIGGQEGIEDRTRQTNQGESTVTTVDVVFSFVDVHSGERLDIPWAGRGDDPADKGLSKAFTDARKSFIVQQLNLRRGDDIEADPRTDERAYRGANGGDTDTVNLTDLAKGLSDAQLNHVLVASGLQAVQKPWASFMRIPTGAAAQIRADLEKVRA